MSHAIYTTPGFLINSHPYGEAGKVLVIFTRELGLVSATAQAIRLEKSKLRPFVQDYSFGIFSLVRGKEFWRLTGAQELPEEIRSAPHTGAREFSGIVAGCARIPENSRAPVCGAGQLFARLALLLRRLLHGEEAHPELFDHILTCKKFLEQNSEISSGQLQTLESLIVFRMMNTLGYVGNDQGLNMYMVSNELSLELLNQAEGKRLSMNQHINKALRESHL